MTKELEKLNLKNNHKTIDLYKSLNEAIYYLKIINQVPLEIIIAKLIKNAKFPMTELEILDELYFISNIDKNRLDLILNYYGFIHVDGQGYYYSEEEKNVKNHVLNIISKLKHIEKLNILDAIHILLLKLGRPLNIDEIKYYLGIFNPISEDELKELISGCSDFKLVGHNTYALAEWENYDEIEYDFPKDLDVFKKRGKVSKRNWEIYRRYKLSIKKTTLQEVGDEFDLTRERVRQIIKKIDKKFYHPINKRTFNKYILFLDELITKYGVLSLDHHKAMMEINKVFNELDIIEAVIFLNIIDRRFTIIDNKYIYQNYKYHRILNYLDYLIKKLGENYIGSKSLESIYKDLGIDKWREKRLVKFLIGKDNRFYIDGNKELCYFARSPFRGHASIIYIILNEVGEPIHHSVIAEKYEELTGEKIGQQVILSYMDRRKDLFTRTFIGTYALKEWGYEEHVFTMDLVIDLLEEKQCIMHYEDIYEFIKDKTQSKKQTMYNLMQIDDRVASLGCGYYGLASYIEDSSNNLEYYSNIIDKDNKRRFGYLLGKGINEYGNTFIIYRVTEEMLNSYAIKIPGVFNINLDFDVYGFDSDQNRYGFKFYKNENDLYGINNFFRKREVKESDIIVLEIISSNIIRVFTEMEYREGYETFSKDKYQKYTSIQIIETEDEEIIEVEDLNSLLKFGLKYGFVYYDDLSTVDLADQYEDMFDLMADLDERGVRFK